MTRQMETAVTHHVLPPACLAAIEADAQALSECPNFWVPRAVVEGREPAITAAEQIVQQLFARLAKAHLAPHADCWKGAEYWCQIYEGGRGLGFHFDKDEHAMKQEGRMANPIWSSVLYITGSHSDVPRQAPTVLIDQWYDHTQGCIVPEHPSWSTLVFPLANQYCIFDGTQAHGVLEAGPPLLLDGLEAGQQGQGQAQQQEPAPQQGQQQQQQEQQQGQQQLHQRRVTFLVNWWRECPESIKRATLEDVHQGKLAAASEGLGVSSCPGGSSGCSRSSSDVGVGTCDEVLGLKRVQCTRVEAPQLQAGDVLPVDELLEQQGIQLSSTDGITIAHPGLTLVPLGEGQYDPSHPLQVLAAFVPTADMAPDGSSSSEDET